MPTSLDRVPNSNIPADAFIVVAIEVEPADASRGMQLPKGTLVKWIGEGWDTDLLDRVYLRPTNEVRTVREAVEGAISGILLHLGGSFVAGKLVYRLRDRFDSGGRHCACLSGGR